MNGGNFLLVGTGNEAGTATTVPDMPTPNHALRGLRMQRRLSVRQLADQAGVSPATVSRIEAGARGSSPETLVRLADALGVAPDLIGGPAERVAS